MSSFYKLKILFEPLFLSEFINNNNIPDLCPICSFQLEQFINKENKTRVIIIPTILKYIYIN